MEAEFAQGSELSQINPGGMPENTVDADTFPEESLEVVQNRMWEASVANGDLHTTDNVTELEEKLKLAQHKIDLENELLHEKDIVKMHAEEKLEQVGLDQEKLSQDEKEREYALKTRERLKIFEIEVRHLKSQLSDSQSKIVQLELEARVANENLDNMERNVLALREKEAVLLEQFAAAEFKAKIAEEKFDMQTELLQKEMKMRSLKDDKLNDARDTFNKQEMDFTQLTDKLQHLECQLKSSINKSEEYERFTEQTNENVVKERDSPTEFEIFSKLSESSAKQMEQIIDSLKEQLHGLCGNVSLNEQKEDTLKKTDTNLFMEEEELNPSLEEISKLGKNLSPDKILMETQDKLSAVEQDLKSAKFKEIELQTRLKNYEEQLTMQESILEQTTTRCMELEELVESQTKDTEMKCQEAKEAFMCAISETKRLNEKLMILEVEVKESENQELQTSASSADSQIEQVKGLITKTQKIARNICLPLRNASVKTEKMSKGENTFEYDARISWIANCIELSNFSLKFVLGVSIVSLLIGLIIGFKD
jgi:myosin heavy subunit